MVSTRLALFGSVVVLLVALALQYPSLEEALDRLGDFVVDEVLPEKNIFILSAAYARWALPCPGATESRKMKAFFAIAVALVAKWNIESARAQAASHVSTASGFLLWQFWPLFLAHINSYLCSAVSNASALAFLLGVQLLGVILYWTTWWYPVAFMLLDSLNMLLPVTEVSNAMHVLRRMVGHEFDEGAAELLIVLSYVQISLGYTNLWYMRQDKARKNALLDVANGKLTARQYLLERTAVYVVSVAVPYMLQRSIMETANSASFRHFFNKVEQSLRVDAFLNSGEDVLNRLEVVRESNYTVDGYSESFNSLLQTSYRLLEAKLYELPNLALLSGMLLSQPVLTLTLLPVSIILDFGRVRAVSFVTKLVEETTRVLRALADKRKKIEQHDTRHAEIITRIGAASMVAGRWEALAAEIFEVTVWRKFLQSTKLYMNWIYYNNLLGVGIECALSRIMELGRITAADIGVYAMVIEDSIGFLLTRYREEASLAEMQTHQLRLQELEEGFKAYAQRLETSSHCYSEAHAGWETLS